MSAAAQSLTARHLALARRAAGDSMELLALLRPERLADGWLGDEPAKSPLLQMLQHRLHELSWGMCDALEGGDFAVLRGRLYPSEPESFFLWGEA